MASSYTSNINLEKPAPGDQSNEWGTTLNNNFDTIDTKLAIKDEDDMSSNSASHLSTQQSIKAYVDANALSLIDEDDMSTDSATRPPSQQSVKAYVDAQVDTEDTISELNDTNISSLAAGQLLLYHNTNSNWTNATLTAGSNVSITNADGSVTIASTDTNTQLTEEQVEDFVGGMVSGNTETGISVTYEDGDGTLDFVVSDTTVAGDSGSTGITPGDTLTIAGGTNVTTAMSGDTLTITATDTNTQLSQEQVEDYVGGMLDGTETFIAVSYDDTDGNIDFVVPVLDEDDMSTDSASHLATQQSIKAYADSVGGSPAADNIAAGDGAINLTTTAGNITIDAQGDDTDIIFKGTDGGVDTTFLTIDGSNAGTASFNVVPITPNPGFKAYRNANQTITHGTWTKVALDTEVYDVGGYFDHSSNYRFTPLVPGYYQINASYQDLTNDDIYDMTIAVYFNGTIGGGMFGRLRIKGVDTTRDFYTSTVQTSDILYMDGVDDYIELYAYILRGGSADPILMGGLYRTTMSAMLISRTG